MECPFCNIEKERIVIENKFACAIYDAFPVTKNHTLIIPKRHVPDYFDLDEKEVLYSEELLKHMKEKLELEDNSIKGFNIGINSGEVAGQTVLHCHIHLIPRRVGDVKNPRGGIRHIIPDKGFY